MEKIINLLLDSMVKHDALSLPMADRYMATENGIPAAVCHMTCWRTITGINAIAHKLIDKVKNTVLVVAEADEGGTPSMLTARMLIEDEKISELEIYLLRSRCQSGFWYKPEQLHELPEGWSIPVPEDGKASRADLEALGNALNNPTIPMPFPGSEYNFGMENGGVVYEHIDYLLGMAPEGAPKPDMSKIPESGRMCMPLFNLFPGPFDPKARIIAIDEEQGLVAVYATVPGTVSPYIVADETSTCFVPDAMIEGHRKTLTPERMAGKSLLKEGKATGMVTTIVKLNAGRVYGFHQNIVLNGYGYICPWEK